MKITIFTVPTQYSQCHVPVPAAAAVPAGAAAAGGVARHDRLQPRAVPRGGLPGHDQSRV